MRQFIAENSWIVVGLHVELELLRNRVLGINDYISKTLKVMLGNLSVLSQSKHVISILKFGFRLLVGL